MQCDMRLAEPFSQIQDPLKQHKSKSAFSPNLTFLKTLVTVDFFFNTLPEGIRVNAPKQSFFGYIDVIPLNSYVNLIGREVQTSTSHSDFFCW